MRIGIVSVAMLLIVYVASADVAAWCDDKRLQFEGLWRNFRDMQYNVPEGHRRPQATVREWNRDREAKLTEFALATRRKYLKQYHVGSIRKDGFHADLPENAVYRGFKVVTGPEVKAQNRTAAKAGRVKNVPGQVKQTS